MKRKENKLQLVFRRKENGASDHTHERKSHSDWSKQMTESGEYQSEPRNPFQTEGKNSVQAFVNKYLNLADIALSTPPSKVAKEQPKFFPKKSRAA